MKRPDSSGKGHIGCSDRYNFNIYKTNIDIKVNSQTREIMHSAVLVDTISTVSRLQDFRTIYLKVTILSKLLIVRGWDKFTYIVMI